MIPRAPRLRGAQALDPSSVRQVRPPHWQPSRVRSPASRIHDPYPPDRVSPPDVHVLGFLNFTHFVATAGYSAIFVLCVLQSCCVPTSSELTLGLAGALAAQGKLNVAAVILVGATGEVIGAYIAWMVGRYAGRAAVDRFGRYILLSQRDLDRAEAWYDRHQRFGVLGSRLLPVIRGFVALPAGIAEVPLVRFGLLTAAGSLLWDGIWAGIGYGVGSHWHAIAKAFGDLGYVLAVVAVGVIAFGAYHRYRSYKQGTLEDPPSGPLPGATGTLRWVGGTSGTAGTGAHDRLAPPLSGEDPENRWVASSSGRPLAQGRRSDFRNSPLAAWEAAVARGYPVAGGGPHEGPRRIARGNPAGGKGSLTSTGDLLGEGRSGVEANGRLTAMLGVLLLVLLAVEGATLLRLGSLLTLHVVIGMVLVPVVLLKIGSTTWRFAQYYLGSPEYRRKGPPPALLRLLGPFVVVTSIAVLASGIALLLEPTGGLRNELLLIHKVTFVLWFAAMVVHVLGHLLDVARLAPRDFYWRTRRQIRGASARQWAVVGAVCVGILLAVAIAPKIGPWLAGRQSGAKTVQLHPAAPAASASRR